MLCYAMPCCAEPCHVMSCYVVLCCVVLCCVVFLPVRTNSHIFCHNGAKTILLYITNFSLLTAAGHPRRGGSVTERTSPLPERSISIKGERFGRELVALQLMSKQPIGVARLGFCLRRPNSRQQKIQIRIPGSCGHSVRVTGPNEPAGSASNWEPLEIFGFSVYKSLGRRVC